MALVHDSTTKDLIKASPRSWLRLTKLDIPDDCPVIIEDADLSHISAAADTVLRVLGPIPWIAHFEFYSRSEPELAIKMIGYHGALVRRWNCWVDCNVLLLRAEANVPNLENQLRDSHPLDPSRQFLLDYRVIRMWTEDVDEFLAGGLGTLPLAVLAKGSNRKTASDVCRRIQRRVEEECVTEGEVRKLLSATKTLLGLKFNAEFAERATRMINLEDSSVVQALLQRRCAESRNAGRDEGETEGRRAMILRMGRRRFGEPAASELARLEAIDQADRLDRIADRLFDAASWRELLKVR